MLEDIDITDCKSEAEIIECYLIIARKVAAWCVRRSYGKLDKQTALSGAMLGLLRAVRRYNPERGCTLRNYIVKMIKYTISDSIRIEVPEMRRRNRIRKVSRPVQFGQSPSVYFKAVPPDDGIDIRDEAIGRVSQLRSSRMRQIVTMHYLEGMTRVSIARKLGLHPSRITQILHDAMEILRSRYELEQEGDR